MSGFSYQIVIAAKAEQVWQAISCTIAHAPVVEVGLRLGMLG